MDFVFPPKLLAVVPVVNQGKFFPVHRIYCVGRNYIEHAKEMGDSGRESPFFFMKPADAVMPVSYGAVGNMPYPTMTHDFQHEIELVVAIGKGGKNIVATEAPYHVWGYAIGFDMTRRDLQSEAKKNGRPWDIGKGFDYSAPITPIHPVAETGLLTNAEISLAVNGVNRQKSDIRKMTWNVAEIIESLSKYYMLSAGDLIFTGTPEGVAAVHPGDLLEGRIEGLGELRIKIV